jgi:hypothetical protein
MIERLELLAAAAELRTNEIVVMTMTATLQWPQVSTSPLDFDFLAFGMGHASNFGLGLALAQPAQHGPENLIVILLENRTYEMTGGQPLPTRVDFEALARAAGVEGGGTGGTGTVERWSTIVEARHGLTRILVEPGPHFVVASVTNSAPLPPVAHSDHAARVTNLRAALGL